jgi:hypothetical protein
MKRFRGWVTSRVSSAVERKRRKIGVFTSTPSGT